MAQTGIYACDSDMLAVFDAVESGMDLVYARMHHQMSPRIQLVHKGRELPGVGSEAVDSSVRSCSWLVAHRDEPIHPRKIELIKGGVRYAIDQLANENTIEVTPGGRLRHTIVLSGRIATVSDTPAAKELMGAFRRAVRKSFERIGAYWVGPAAVGVLDRGGRLTIATQSPPSFNLVRA